jgi:hypothetical protein
MKFENLSINDKLKLIETLSNNKLKALYIKETNLIVLKAIIKKLNLEIFE